MLHLAAFTESIDNTANNDVAFLQDDYLDNVNSHARLRSPMSLVAAAALCVDLDRVRIDSPSIRLVGNPFIRPISAALLPPNDPNLMDLTRNPFKLVVGEEIALQATHTNVAAQRFTGLIWLADRIIPVPMGDIYAVRFTSVTAAVINAWTTLVITLDQAIAPGEYALVGSEVISTNAIAHRWIIPDRPWRPGCLSAQAAGSRTHKLFYQNGLGEWGRFLNTSLPQLQVLCNVADAVHTGWMYIIRMRSTTPG